MKTKYTYKFGTYSSEHMFNEIQKKYGDNYPSWRVHSWQVNEGDGSITVLWEKETKENTDNGKSE
jgi:hypothetical protein